MTIPTDWEKICGVNIAEDGQMAAVWLARNPDTDIVRLYDSLVQAREVLAVRAAMISARGRHVPIAWYRDAEEVAERLLYDYSMNMVRDPVDSSDAAADLLSLDLEERMRSKRFVVERDQVAWQDEYKTFTRRDQKVPRGSHPLMAATRCAIARLDEAVSLEAVRHRPKPKKLSIV